MGGDEKTDRERMETPLADASDAGLVADAVIAQNEAQRKQLWAMRDDVEQCNRFQPLFIFDVSLPIPKMEGYVASVNSLLAKSFDVFRNFTFGHIGDGNLHFAISAGLDESVRETVEQAVYQPLAAINGSVAAEHGVGLERKPYLTISRSLEELELMRTLKNALDPKWILNPGKILDRNSASSTPI